MESIYSVNILTLDFVCLIFFICFWIVSKRITMLEERLDSLEDRVIALERNIKIKDSE